MFDSENGNFDIQKRHINEKGTYVITAGLTNNGILGKTDIKAKVFDENTITVDMFGNSFFRYFKYKMVTHARVFALLPKFNMNDGRGLYIVNSFKFLTSKFGYENMCSWGKIKNESIQLPQKNGEIDFEFMESFIAELNAQRIAELNAQRIAELNAYLTVTGLKDYELTEEEKIVLENLDKIEYQEKDITDVFKVKNAGNILAREVELNSGDTPYLCASAENNSVASYIKYGQSPKDEGNCIFIGGKTFVVSYQEKDFYSNDSHNLALYLLDDNYRNKDIQLFLSSCVKKSLGHKYSWGDSISNKKIQKDTIVVPIKNGKIDYEIMKIIHRIIEKLVIKDVALWADKKIEATKQVANRN